MSTALAAGDLRDPESPALRQLFEAVATAREAYTLAFELCPKAEELLIRCGGGPA